MGRKKLNRVKPLYTRVSKENAEYINKVSKLAKMNKTAWLDSHISYLRDNYKTMAYQHIAKARD